MEREGLEDPWPGKGRMHGSGVFRGSSYQREQLFIGVFLRFLLYIVLGF
jgi:hypothetical protein